MGDIGRKITVRDPTPEKNRKHYLKKTKAKKGLVPFLFKR
jgi:hypothetical protein